MAKKVNLKKIARELGIDKPIVKTRMVGERVEVYLYDGQVLLWPEKPLERSHVGTLECGSAIKDQESRIEDEESGSKKKTKKGRNKK